MADQIFNFSWVPNGYGARLQRQAVLYPLTGRAKSVEEISQKAQRLVTIWRARLHALKQVGWSPGVKVKDTQYARNCPPTFVYTTPHTRQCKIRHLCPFCYARWVRDTWERLDETFPNPRSQAEVEKLSPTSGEAAADDMDEAQTAHGGVHDGRRLRSIDLGGEHGADEEVRDFPFHLLTREIKKEAGFTRDREGETYNSYAAHLLGKLAHARAQTITLMDTLGSFAFTQMVPIETGWKILHKELHIVSADYVLPDGIGGTIKRVERPTRRRIFQTTAKVCQYPTELMFGDAEMTKVALEARQGLRLAASYGVCRRSHRRI